MTQGHQPVGFGLQQALADAPGARRAGVGWSHHHDALEAAFEQLKVGHRAGVAPPELRRDDCPLAKPAVGGRQGRLRVARVRFQLLAPAEK